LVEKTRNKKRRAPDRTYMCKQIKEPLCGTSNTIKTAGAAECAEIGSGGGGHAGRGRYGGIG